MLCVLYMKKDSCLISKETVTLLEECLLLNATESKTNRLPKDVKFILFCGIFFFRQRSLREIFSCEYLNKELQGIPSNLSGFTKGHFSQKALPEMEVTPLKEYIKQEKWDSCATSKFNYLCYQI